MVGWLRLVEDRKGNSALLRMRLPKHVEGRRIILLITHDRRSVFACRCQRGCAAGT